MIHHGHHKNHDYQRFRQAAFLSLSIVHTFCAGTQHGRFASRNIGLTGQKESDILFPRKEWEQENP